ncbi:MAG: hypothetical protein WBI65_01595 [Dethiobacteria bacterium]
MYDWNSETGWARHYIFGLRREWLDMVLLDPQGWSHHTILGNRQVDSLKVWLRTSGIQDRSGKFTFLGEQFVSQGSNCLPLWELLWVNVVFNFPTARWYVTLEGKEWTTTGLVELLQVTIPRLANRTVSNAVMELTGLLERTPVGTELKQGQVLKRRPREIARAGCKPSDAAIVHSMGRLFLQQGGTRLLWNSNLAWPWIVFRCSRQFVWERLTSLDKGYFCLDEHGVTLCKENKEGWNCGDMMTTLL